MNLIRTAMLLAFLTALFMAVGYLIGGSGGMLIAFLIAAGMNLFSYWNADRMVLSMHHAQEVDERSAPEYYRIVRDLAQRAGLPMPKVYVIDNPQPRHPYHDDHSDAGRRDLHARQLRFLLRRQSQQQ